MTIADTLFIMSRDLIAQRKGYFMTNYRKLFTYFLRDDQIHEDELMSQHTTFGIGGPADYFITPETEKELQQVVSITYQEGLPLFVLGGGANLLVRDKGVRGVVIYTGGIRGIEKEGNLLHVASGMSTCSVAQVACRYGLSGMEFAAGIPGSIGGAVYMNAGAYDGEISQIVESVISCNQKGELVERNNENICYRYRHSIFMENQEVILSIVLKLVPGVAKDIKAQMDEFNHRRRTKQPLEKKSAGSTFKRPEGHFVGQMIEELELKGFSVGDAQVSEKHAGFLINNGKASCADMLQLISEIQRRVREKYHVELNPEIQIIGEE